LYAGKDNILYLDTSNINKAVLILSKGELKQIPKNCREGF